MARPIRNAAERAKELIAKGFAKKILDPEEEEVMSSGEEEELDELLDVSDEENFGEEDNESAFSSDEDEDQWRTAPSRRPIIDDFNPIVPEFRPEHPPGPILDEASRQSRRGRYRALDFFSLFITREIMEMICAHTNIYAWTKILDKQSYAKSDGSWDEVTLREMESWIGLIILMGIIRIPDIGRYWSQATLYSGGWASRFMSRTRYKALAGMIHVSDPGTEDQHDKLAKIRPLLDHLKSAYTKLYQPKKQICVDERLVKSKGRSGIRQYMPAKPARFGYKLWCLCEAGSGYTLDFDVYTGRRHNPTRNGLAFDVVSSLVERYTGQGYWCFFDNFFTSVPLLKHLVANGLAGCGTTLSHRRACPEELKDKAWHKRAKRGDSRFVRNDGILCQQWHDSKSVCVCSTVHKADEFVTASRHHKKPDGSHERITVRKPKAINDYNSYMRGVDISDQRLVTYNILHKSRRWWRSLFYHLLDMTILNSFLLFTKCQEMHPDVDGLKRPAGYSHLSFQEELARQLARIRDDEDPPFSTPRPRIMTYFAMELVHVPDRLPDRRNCRVCTILQGKALRTNWFCSNDQCNAPLCINKDRNCFKLWHTDEFQRLRHRIGK